MKKIFKNVLLLVSTIVVIALVPLFLSHDSPIPVEVPYLDVKELAQQKEENAKAEKEAARKARIRRIYACKEDSDCLIVDKDPCGCSVGPQGVVAVNGSHITDFNALNQSKAIAQTCSETVSREKECSPSARPVCRANVCKIAY